MSDSEIEFPAPVTSPLTPEESALAEVVLDRRPLDDDGNALRLADWYAGNLRYVVGEGYAAWDDTRWRHDDDGAAVRAAREIVDIIRTRARRAAAELGDKDDLAKALRQHARRTGSARGIQSMLGLAQSDLRLMQRPEQLDVDPFLLNAPNGTIDLRTSELRPHSRDDLITRRTAAVYDPDAEAPTWKKFLERVQPDEEARAYLQRMSGAAAVGHNEDELLHVEHGSGANGKTKAVRTIAAALGDYAATADAQLLLAGQRHRAGQPELVRLRGARLLVAGETDEGDRLNVALVKALTGGDTIACRLLYENAIVEFVPVFSPWLVTNHRPQIREQSEAIWRRVRLVPFMLTIPRRERDPALQGKLLAELPGVLAWIVEGARLYLDEGLEPPDMVETATKTYRDEEDVVGRFIADCCEVGENVLGRGKRPLLRLEGLVHRQRRGARHADGVRPAALRAAQRGRQTAISARPRRPDARPDGPAAPGNRAGGQARVTGRLGTRHAPLAQPGRKASPDDGLRGFLHKPLYAHARARGEFCPEPVKPANRSRRPGGGEP